LATDADSSALMDWDQELLIVDEIFPPSPSEKVNNINYFACFWSKQNALACYPRALQTVYSGHYKLPFSLTISLFSLFIAKLSSSWQFQLKLS
jgi:hypothetical protein